MRVSQLHAPLLIFVLTSVAFACKFASKRDDAPAAPEPPDSRPTDPEKCDNTADATCERTDPDTGGDLDKKPDGGPFAQFLAKPIGILDGIGKGFFSAETDEGSRYLNQGVALLNTFAYVDAIRSFHAAIKKKPESILARVGFVLACLSHDKDQAIYFANQSYQDLKQLKAKRTISPYEAAWANYAGAHLKRISRRPSAFPEIIDNAATAYEKLLSSFPADIEVLTLGKYLLQQPGPELREFQKLALSINPTHVGALHYLSLYLDASGLRNAARAYAKRLVAAAPSAAQAHGHLRILMGRSPGEPDGSVAAAQIRNLNWRDGKWQADGPIATGRYHQTFPGFDDSGNSAAYLTLSDVQGMQGRGRFQDAAARPDPVLSYQTGDRAPATIQKLAAVLGYDSLAYRVAKDTKCQDEDSLVSKIEVASAALTSRATKESYGNSLEFLLFIQRSAQSNGCEKVDQALQKIVASIAQIP